MGSYGSEDLCLVFAVRKPSLEMMGNHGSEDRCLVWGKWLGIERGDLFTSFTSSNVFHLRDPH